LIIFHATLFSPFRRHAAWLMPAPPFSLALFSPDLLAAAIIAAVILMIYDERHFSIRHYFFRLILHA
jgi:hypothetical protein